MEVYLTKMAIKAYFRTAGLEPHPRESMETSIPAHEGHRSFIHDIITHQGLNYLNNPLDSIPPVRWWDRGYKVDLDSMDPKKEGNGTPDPALPGVSIFTDGSKAKDGTSTGAGIVFYKNGSPIIRNHQALFYVTRLHRSNSVFQTDIVELSVYKATAFKEF